MNNTYILPPAIRRLVLLVFVGAFQVKTLPVTKIFSEINEQYLYFTSGGSPVVAYFSSKW